jgi:hypothetical protein
MNSFKTSLIAKCIAAACFAAGLASPAVAQFREAPNGGSADDGVQCRSAPNPYTGTLSNLRFLCKRTLNANQALTCSEPGFPTKFIREGPGGGGKDVCAAPDRFYPANVPLTGTQNTDWKYVVVGPAQVSTIVANQRQREASAMGLNLSDVDAKALSSEVVVNHTGSEDRLKVVIEFATYAVAAPGGLIGNQGPLGLPATVNATSTFQPRPLPQR